MLELSVVAEFVLVELYHLTQMIARLCSSALQQHDAGTSTPTSPPTQSARRGLRHLSHRLLQLSIGAEGTLDDESLDAVIDVFERLRVSDRLIGIITHAPQLADRIPDGLLVERSAGGQFNPQASALD